jgi:anti-sigma factor RsiW
MNCNRVQQALDALADGELGRWNAWRMERHLARCAACSAAREETRRLGEQARAWRNVTAPQALKARIAAALAASPQPEERTPAPAVSPRSISAKEKLRMAATRWGWAMTLAAILAALWVGSPRGGDAVAAAIRATEAAPAVHLVGHGSRGTTVEGWVLAGVGSYIRVEGPGRETIMVDDLKHRFDYDVQGRRVATMPSSMADPKEAARDLEFFSATGTLRQLQKHHAVRDILVSTVVHNGRRLRRITARGESSLVYVDPATNRVVLMEDWSSAPDPQYERTEIDYPDPASVNRALFQFKVPPGVTVHPIPALSDSAERALRKATRRGPTGEQICLNSHLPQLAEALRRYVNDHHGQWPDALRPALDPYVKGPEVFLCPLDRHPNTEAASYDYHRPTGRLAAVALAEMNDLMPRDRTHPTRGSMILIECRHHYGIIWHVDTRDQISGRIVTRPPK